MTHLSSHNCKQLVVGQQRFHQTLVQKVSMAVYDVFKGFYPLQILGKAEPIFFNNFVAKVVYEILDEVYHPLVEEVGRGEEFKGSLFG